MITKESVEFFSIGYSYYFPTDYKSSLLMAVSGYLNTVVTNADKYPEYKFSIDLNLVLDGKLYTWPESKEKIQDIPDSGCVTYTLSLNGYPCCCGHDFYSTILSGLTRDDLVESIQAIVIERFDCGINFDVYKFDDKGFHLAELTEYSKLPRTNEHYSQLMEPIALHGERMLNYDEFKNEVLEKFRTHSGIDCTEETLFDDISVYDKEELLELYKCGMVTEEDLKEDQEYLDNPNLKCIDDGISLYAKDCDSDAIEELTQFMIEIRDLAKKYDIISEVGIYPSLNFITKIEPEKLVNGQFEISAFIVLFDIENDFEVSYLGYQDKPIIFTDEYYGYDDDDDNDDE